MHIKCDQVTSNSFLVEAIFSLSLNSHFTQNKKLKFQNYHEGKLYFDRHK